jgi:hypothetical protein
MFLFIVVYVCMYVFVCVCVCENVRKSRNYVIRGVLDQGSSALILSAPAKSTYTSTGAWAMFRAATWLSGGEGLHSNLI